MSTESKAFNKAIKETQSRILKLIEKEHQLVVKNHYFNIWLPVGMALIGLPIGLAFASGLNNMAFISFGLPIGLSMGMALGISMDRKALEEGRQLNFELKY